jgi:hypothetical protein
MRRFWKIAVGIVAVPVIGWTVLVLNVNLNCWYQRLQAERVLRVLRTMTPGKTSKESFLAETSVFRRPWPDGPEGAFDIENLPTFPRWGYRIPFYAEGSWWPEGTDFRVVPRFRDGILTHLEICEEEIVSGHPPGACILWGEVRPAIGDASYRGELFSSYLADDDSRALFSGYQVSGWDGDFGYIVVLDDRATQGERASALDFKTYCFTRLDGCMDKYQFLSPAPGR